MPKKYLFAPFEVKSDSVKEDGTFEGYASLFDNEPDAYNDIVVSGAFKKSIERGGRNRTGIALLWQHEAKEPIGKWLSMLEDSVGLASIGKLTRGVQRADEAYLLLKDQAIKGLSIGYDFPKDKNGKILPSSYDYDKDKDIRYIKEVDLWETSLVTFPAKIPANVIGVKDIESIKTPHELEDILREAGLSREAAKYVVKLARPSLREAQVEDKLNVKGLAEVLANLREVNVAIELSRELSK